MPHHAIRELTNLAIEMFDAQPDIGDFLRSQIQTGLGDPVLDGALAPNGRFLDFYRGSALDEAVEAVKGDPEMEPLLPREGEADPMLSSAMGGSRQDFHSLVRSMVTSAQRSMYFDHSDQSAAILVQRAIQNYEDLKRIARGEPIRIGIVHGIGGVILPPDAQVSTPWGIVKAAPAAPNQGAYAMASFRPATTAILLREHTSTITISRDESPMARPDLDLFEQQQRMSELLPLAFALAAEGEKRCAPMLTFTTSIQPFGAAFGSTWSGRFGTPWQQTTVLEGEIPSIEDWARRLNTRHVENLKVTARRIVSAIAERTDRSDSLVDTVMAWESLVGTKNETVFRVTAALSKLLETDPAERRDLRKSLGATYETRSRVVHGDAVDEARIAEEADKAIDVALAATRAIYRRSPEWLNYTSSERADRLILEE